MSGQSSGSSDSSSSDDTGSAVTAGAAGAGGGAVAGSALGPYGAAAGAVIGATIGVVGALTSGASQAQIDAEKQALENQQADEVLQRERINDALRQTQLFKSSADISSEAAATGHEGAGIGSQLELKRQADLQSTIEDQEAQFQAGMLRAGATMQGQAGSQAQEAGELSAASSVLGGVGRVVNPNAGIVNYGGSPQSLPAPGETYSLGTQVPTFT